MDVYIREYNKEDLWDMMIIWNDVVEEGAAFPQIDGLTKETAEDFFSFQSFTAVAELEGEIIGLYILHPNNIGHCGHIGNASYIVKGSIRGKKVGEKLVLHSLAKAKELGFLVLQFNAVVKTNKEAIHLYRKLGFIELGTIPGGFLCKNNTYEDIVLFYRPL